MDRQIPPLEPLAPIVDRMRTLARQEIPAGRTCRVVLYDDGTFRAQIYHSENKSDMQGIVYEPTTTQILRVYLQGHSYNANEFTLETLYTPTWEETEVEELEAVEPPYR